MKISDIVDIPNLVKKVDKQTLLRIGSDVVSEYNIDKSSMKDWLDRNKLAMKLIDQKPEQKTDPWPGAANTKLPLVLNAAMKASAEEYAEILRGDEIVKTAIFGTKTPDKEKRAERVKKRMNFQILHEMEDWSEDHDKLVLAKNILGTVHKKYFYADDKIQCVLRRGGVVINDNVERISEASRITDEIEKTWWQAEEKFRNGEWERIELSQNEDQGQAEKDKVNLFLEQLRREDLDGDGYPEPYIVTVHERTSQVVRITPNFTPESITFDDAGEVVKIDLTKSRIKYVRYDMIPSWEGGYWGFGFGILLGPLNENCNQLVNHLLNSGHLANNGGGFINSGVKLKSGELKFRSNEWKVIQSFGGDLARNIVPLPVKEPSQTLYSLLGLLMDVLRELSSVTEVMSGEQPRANMPAASVMALIEQGKKLFNSVYKRHYRALSKEILALFDLNFLYEDPQKYLAFHDLNIPSELAVPLIKGDFERDALDVLPTANPEFSSRMQRMAESSALMEIKDDPRVNGQLIIRRYVEGILDDVELANQMVPEQPNLTPAQVMEQVQIKTQEFLASNEARKSEAEARQAEIDLQIKAIEAQKQGVKLPLEIEKMVLQNQKAEIAVINETLKREPQSE